MRTPSIVLWTGIFVFLLSSSGLTFFDEFYARQALKRDSRQLLSLFHNTLADARKSLDSLPDPASLTCSADSVRQFIDAEFYSTSIRWIGFFDGKGNSCHSDARHIKLDTYASHQIDDNYELAVAKRDSGHWDLILICTSGETRFAANLDPFTVQHMAGFPCEGCLGFRFEIHGEPALKFEHRSFDGKPVVNYSALYDESGFKVGLIMLANRTFLNHYKNIGWATTVAISLLLAAVAAFATKRLLAHRQSLESVIKYALAEREFAPFYQPIIDSRNSQIIGVEVLIRWMRNDGSIRVHTGGRGIWLNYWNH